MDYEAYLEKKSDMLESALSDESCEGYRLRWRVRELEDENRLLIAKIDSLKSEINSLYASDVCPWVR